MRNGFVEATGYVTVAERGVGEVGRGRLPPDLLVPGSMSSARRLRLSAILAT